MKSKLKAKRKLQNQPVQNGSLIKKARISNIAEEVETPEPTSAPSATSLQSLFTSDEIATTLEVLNLLAENPAVIKSKGCKDLRSAVYEFRQACTTGLNNVAGLHYLFLDPFPPQYKS